MMTDLDNINFDDLEARAVSKELIEEMQNNVFPPMFISKDADHKPSAAERLIRRLQGIGILGKDFSVPTPVEKFRDVDISVDSDEPKQIELK